MSYCRWSSDLFMCDVYVYEDCAGGWTTHVAGRRLKGPIPDEIKNMPSDTVEGNIAQHIAMAEYLRKNEGKLDYLWLRPISPHAGESYNDPTPGTCAARLRDIKASGLNVPQYAIDQLERESRGEQ